MMAIARRPRRILRRTFSTLLALSLTVALAGACGGSATGRTTEGALQVALLRAQARVAAPGVLAAVWTPESEWVETSGLADVEILRPLAPGDLLRIGSVTKTFVATLALLLVQDGQLRLEDTLDRFRPEFPYSDRVTVEQLLNHTSGIYSWDGDPAVWEEIFGDPERSWSVEEMIELAATQPFAFEPGTGYQYSNTNYFLLGTIIEALAGQTVDAFLQARICEPLGLQRTFFADAPTLPEETVRGYEQVGGAIREVSRTDLARVVNYELAWTAGGIVSTLADLRIWARALATGSLLTPELHDLQIPRPRPPTDEVPVVTGYGLGLALQDEWLGHTGGVAGYSIMVYFHPRHEAAIITFMNKFDVRDEAANARDLAAHTVLFIELSRAVFPDTYPDLEDPDDFWPYAAN